MRSVPALAAALALLAGCVTPAATEAAPAASDLAFPTPETPFDALLCEGDALLQLGQPREATCNVKVTQDGPAAEVHFVASPIDPMVLVGGAKDFRLPPDARCGKFSVWSGTYRSTDGGRTWATGLLPGHPGDARLTALSDYGCGSDPVLAFAPDGTLYYASLMFSLRPGSDPLVPQLAPVLGYETERSAIAVTRSRDGGASWDDPVLVVAVEAGLLDKQWIAVDPTTGDVHVSYFSNEGDVVATVSRDQGATWSDAVPLVASQQLPSTPRQGQFAQIAATADGVVHAIAWAAGDPLEPSAILHRATSDRGASWSEPVRVVRWAPVIDGGFLYPYRLVTLPALAAHPRDPALYVAFPAPAASGADTRAHADLDILVVSSRDGGATWGAPVRVNDDAMGAANMQWMPAVAVGPEGTLHVTWIDYREDPGGRLAKVYYARSSDDGATFSVNAALSDVAFDGEGGYHQNGGGTIGDYMGLAATPLAAHAFWADTREGRNDVFGAILPAGS